jgi:Ni,Fe-hydrogenase III large subunit
MKEMKETVVFPHLKNGQAIDVAQVPLLDMDALREKIIAMTQAGWRLSAFFGARFPDGVRLYAILSDDSQGILMPMSANAPGQYRSITPECPQAHMFEREIWEQYQIRPLGHPWLKPVRFPRAKDEKSGTAPRIGITDYFVMQGEEVHEVGVGPVHAGVIEPGHFRFECHGENVYHLEISLGYQYRGVEKQLIGGPHKRTLFHMETVAGDTSIAHSTAYCHILEALANTQTTERAHAIRAIALELERLANHTGDLGALAGDVAFLSTASACGALRGDYLNLSALICGSRLGRSLNKVAGVRFDIDKERGAEIKKRLHKAFVGTKRTAELLFDTPSVLSRFEHTGTLEPQAAIDIGLVGPAARACGLKRDIRTTHPFGIFARYPIQMANWQTNDVMARGMMRWLEIQNSVAFIRDMVDNLPAGDICVTAGPLAPDKLVVAMTEGWRGEVCHVAITDAHGKFAHYKISDPSFHNWFGLALCLRGQAIFDFPLCNKSFNLSYCGFDL